MNRGDHPRTLEKSLERQTVPVANSFERPRYMSSGRQRQPAKTRLGLQAPRAPAKCGEGRKRWMTRTRDILRKFAGDR